MVLSDEVIEAKNGEAAFRPGRGGACSAVGRDGKRYGSRRLAGIWRQIMTASLIRQKKDLTFAVHQAALPAAIWHMGSALTARHCDDFDAVLTLLDSARCRYKACTRNKR